MSDNWGILTVSNGALPGANWNKKTSFRPSAMIRVVSGFDVEIVMSGAISVRNPYYKIILSLFDRICFVNGIVETRTKIVPSTATIDDPAGKSKWNETKRPRKLPKKLTNIAITTTVLLERASIIAQTDGIIKYEKTGITPLTFTAKTIDKPIDI